jgi:CheY-like chemotaxis protein/predicted regulator of Ras-like GTPase activity (Roadblock/LC7/MglB family)
MKKLLIVEDEASEREKLKKAVEESFPHLEVLAAANGKEAVQTLQATPVSLVLTDLHMPTMDGFELLAHMNTQLPDIPAVVMGESRSSEDERQLNEMGHMEYLEKPVEVQTLKKTLERSLKTERASGALTGISIGSFLQLIELEQKTCLLEVRHESREKKGYLYLHEGDLFDAVYGDMKSEKAALEIMSWDNVDIRFKTMPNRRISKRIHTELKGLIMEAMRLKDEKGEDQEVTDLLDDAEILQIDDLEPLEEDTAGSSEKAEPEAEGADPASAAQEGAGSMAMQKSADGEASGSTGASDSAMQVREDTDPAGEAGEYDQSQAATNSASDNFSKGGESMAGLKGTLQNMGQEIDGVIAVGVVGMDGITVAEHNPAGANTDSFSAKFTMVMKLVQRSIAELKEMGALKEDLVQTKNAWVLMRFVNDQYWLGIAVSRESTLGNVRLVANKYMKEIKQAVSG